MTSRTPNLDLILQFLEDYADKRIDNINWEILDKWAKNHSHDGIDSHLIDLDSIWAAINELRRLIHQQRIDHNELVIIVRQLIAEYQRHKHYDLDSPPSIETHWFDTFHDLRNVDPATTASVSTALGLLHLPANYKANQPYHYVSKPFDLAHTLVPNPDPDVQPAQANARLFMTRQGDVTPYLVIGNDLKASPNLPRKYPGAVAGVNKSIQAVDNYITSKLTFNGKKFGDLTVPHEAYHHHDIARPLIGGFTQVGPLGVQIPAAPGYTFRQEFSDADYARLSVADGTTNSTQPEYEGSRPNQTVKPVRATPKVLYHGDKVLSWGKLENKFYWFNAQSNDFDNIEDTEIPDIAHPNLVGVAANVDAVTGAIWVFKTWVEAVDQPAGYFDVVHQVVVWDGKEDFAKGPVFKSARCKRKHWPRPFVICPTHLHVSGNNVHVITHTSYDDLDEENEILVNYYDNDAHDNYMWFPFVKVYGNLHKTATNATFTHFNPGILGTHHSFRKDEPWRCYGPSKLIEGAYNATGNPWASLSDSDINAFEGGNDNVFLGMEDNEIFFYQSFVEYNGADVLIKGKWKDQDFRNRYPDNAWHGIVAHNVSTGQKRFIRGNMPFMVNVAATIDDYAKNAQFMGGLELVKQFVTEDDRILATENNVAPLNTVIKYAFWADRLSPGVVLPENVNVEQHMINPVLVNLTTGHTTRVETDNDVSSLANTSNLGIMLPDEDVFDAAVSGMANADATQVSRITQNASGTGRITQTAIVSQRIHKAKVVKTKKSVVKVGGKHIHNHVIRPRKKHPPAKKVVVWNGAMKNNSRARQVYYFELGDNVGENDIVKVHVKAKSEGKYPTIQPFENPGRNDIFVNQSVAYGDHGWRAVGLINNKDNGNVFIVNDLSMARRFKLIICLENARVNDSAAKIASKIHTEYIYVTVERAGYIYEYEWTDLPDSGTQGAVVLECASGATFSTRGQGPVGVTSSEDVDGIKIDSAEVSILANKDG